MPVVEEGVITVSKPAAKKPKARPARSQDMSSSSSSENASQHSSTRQKGSKDRANSNTGSKSHKEEDNKQAGKRSLPTNKRGPGPHSAGNSNVDNDSDSDDSTNDHDLDEDDDSREKCHICSSSIHIKAFYPCNHVTCHKCALRTRGLARDMHCLFCRADQKIIIVSAKLNNEYNDFAQEELKYANKNLGMLFDDEKTQAKVELLLSLRCRMKSCPKRHDNFTKWKELKRHMQEDHGKRFCDLCVTHLHAFPVEQNVYNREQLYKHESVGNKKQGFNGHPLCEYCNKRFYSNDELMKHCITDHEKCFVCEQIDPTVPPQFFRNYNALEEHFIREHYACRVQSCVDQKFVVFRHKEELQQHMVEKHKEIIGKSKAARVIDTELPAYRPNHNGTGRFASRLTTMPSELSSASTSTSTSSSSSFRSPLQSNYSQAFPELGAARSETSSPAPPPIREPGYVAAFHQNLPRQDPNINNTGRRLEERAKILLQKQPESLDRFKTINTDFQDKGSGVTADQLISEYTSIFKSSTDDQIEVLLQEMADLMRPKNTQKSRQLEEATKSWASKRPLIKKETNVISNAGSVWLSNSSRGRGSLTPDNFPSLPTQEKSKHPLSSTTSLPSLSSLSSTSSSKPYANMSSNARTTTGGFGKKVNGFSSPPVVLNSEKFPQLPTVTKSFKPLEPKNPVKSVWGGSSTEEYQSQKQNGGEEEFPELGEGSSSSASGHRRKGKKKTVLYSFSTFK